MAAKASSPHGASPEVKPDQAGDLTGLPFEQALAELEEIVKRLERGDVPLDDSIAIYERGEALKAHCEALLKRAEARIETITSGPDGKASGTRALDVDSATGGAR